MKFELNKENIILGIALLALLGVSVFTYRTITGSSYHKVVQGAQTPGRLQTKQLAPPQTFSTKSAITGKTALVPIFMYHHVGPLPQNADAITTDLTVPENSFAEEVKWTSEQGYHTITLENLYQYSQGKFEMPAKPAIFTFDDGYADVFNFAVPILKKYSYIGSFGIITKKVGDIEGTNTYATWDQIAEAQKQGMEIVSHTQTHFDGTSPKYNYQYIVSDLSGSIQDLKNHLGITTNILIYPYGHYNDQYRKAMHEAGIVMGVSEIQRATVALNDLDQVPRIRVHGQETMQSFEKIFNFEVRKGALLAHY